MLSSFLFVEDGQERVLVMTTTSGLLHIFLGYDRMPYETILLISGESIPIPNVVVAINNWRLPPTITEKDKNTSFFFSSINTSVNKSIIL